MITFAQTERSSPRIEQLSHLDNGNALPAGGSGDQLYAREMVNEATQRSFELDRVA